MRSSHAASRLDGKVALVSGGARGMGASHAEALVGAGASVMITDVLDDEGEALARRLGAAAEYHHLDVTSPEGWRSAVHRATSAFGSLNVLVNNAGIVNSGPVDEYTVEQWNAIIAVNLTGVFLGISAASAALKLGAPSSIINVSSTAGLRGYADLPGYTASKFGVTGLTKAAALDLGTCGVRVNSVHPGVTTTPMTADMQIDMGHVALGRIAQPHEVSALVVFLASDESSYCTGAQFAADGGDTAGMTRVR